MTSAFSFISIFVLVLSFLIFRYINSINIAGLCHLESRPVIYGEDFCGEVYHNKITITSSTLRRFVDLLAPKTVLYASIADQKIVLKNLVPPGDFKKTEESFYNKFNDEVLHSQRSVEIIKLHIHESIRFKPGSLLNPKLRLCPYSSNVENLFKKLNAEKYLLQDYLHLWTILQSNPEPLLLKLLKPPEWPVPEFYGSCGRIIAVEDSGLMLSYFYNAPWVLRANLTYQLLQSAFDFTFADPDFAYYFTDMSPDNLAVTARGKLKFIDLEHVIMTDRKPFIGAEDLQEWMTNHTSRHQPCKECIIFETDELCRHSVSDHNFYAACKEILSPSAMFPKGFLHSHPSSFPDLSQLEDLITDCVEAFKKPRFESAKEIMDLLKKHSYYLM